MPVDRVAEARQVQRKETAAELVGELRNEPNTKETEEKNNISEQRLCVESQL
jgi:hypothetical protein